MRRPATSSERQRVRPDTGDPKENEVATKVEQYVKTMAKKGYKRCPVCVSGNGMYKNIAKHNRSQHNGRAPKKAA
jgi:nicotinic acid phosphoribosyltransferase